MNSKCREKHEASQVPSPQKPRRIRAQHASHPKLERLIANPVHAFDGAEEVA